MSGHYGQACLPLQFGSETVLRSRKQLWQFFQDDILSRISFNLDMGRVSGLSKLPI